MKLYTIKAIKTTRPILIQAFFKQNIRFFTHILK